MTNEVDLIQKNIHCHLSLGDLPSALDELQKWINALLSDGRIMGNVFGSLELDQLCLKIGESALNLKSPSAQSDLSQSQVDIVFVASEFYMTGGHTALVEDYIKALEVLEAVDEDALQAHQVASSWLRASRMWPWSTSQLNCL